MPADLTIFVPTRGRPQNAARLAYEANKTSQANTKLVFVVNEDDPTLSDYQREIEGVLVCPPGERGIVHPLNWGFKNVSLGYATGFFGDDVLPKTQGWDRKLLRYLREMGTGLVYGNDKLQGPSIATHPILSSNIPQTLGWLAYPQLKHLCVDVVLHRMATDLGKCSYIDFIVLEHLHRANGKAPDDDGYEYVNSQPIQQHDSVAHLAYLNSQEYQYDLIKLRSLL